MVLLKGPPPQLKRGLNRCTGWSGASAAAGASAANRKLQFQQSEPSSAAVPVSSQGPASLSCMPPRSPPAGT